MSRNLFRPLGNKGGTNVRTIDQAPGVAKEKRKFFWKSHRDLLAL